MRRLGFRENRSRLGRAEGYRKRGRPNRRWIGYMKKSCRGEDRLELPHSQDLHTSDMTRRPPTKYWLGGRHHRPPTSAWGDLWSGQALCRCCQVFCKRQSCELHQCLRPVGKSCMEVGDSAFLGGSEFASGFQPACQQELSKVLNLLSEGQLLGLLRESRA